MDMIFFLIDDDSGIAFVIGDNDVKCGILNILVLKFNFLKNNLILLFTVNFNFVILNNNLSIFVYTYISFPKLYSSKEFIVRFFSTHFYFFFVF